MIRANQFAQIRLLIVCATKFLRFSPEVRVNFRRLFFFYRLLGHPFIRENLMSIIYPPAILGPEMAAPILWAPGIFDSFCWKTPVPIKFLVLGWVVFFFGRGGWKCRFYFYGRGDPSEFANLRDQFWNCWGWLCNPESLPTF